MRRVAAIRLAALALALCSLAVFLPAQGQAAPSRADTLQLTVRPGFGGALKLGTWVPVELEIQNVGAATVGEVQVQVDGQSNRGVFNRPPAVYSAPVELPSRARKRLTMEVFIPSVDEKLRAQIVAEGQSFGAQEVAFERVAAGELFCGVMTGGRTGLDFLGGIDLGGPHRRPRLVTLDVADIPPSPHLLQSLDCLIVSNVSTAPLGDGQRSALDSWVDSGGLLIVGGGSGVQKTVAGLPRDLLPVRVSSTLPVGSLEGLGALVGKPFPEQGPWLVGDAVPTNGVQVVEQDGVAVLAAGRRGLGSVVYLGVDPTTEPLRGWEGEETFWRHLLSYAPAPSNSQSGIARPLTGWGRQPRAALSDIGGYREGPPLWLIYLLAGYAVLVGPVNYLFLRRLRHLEWSLGTIPLTTLVFVGLAFAGARANPASDVVVNEITILRSYDREQAVARSYLGLFALRDLSADLSLPSGSLVSPQYFPYPIDSANQTRPPNWSLDIRGGEQKALRQVSLRSGGLATIAVDGARQLPGRLDAEVVVDGNSVSGQVTSRLSRSLKSAALVVGSNVVRLGDIRPNETHPVSLELSTAYPDPGAIVRQIYPTESEPSPPEEVPLRDLLQGVLNSNIGTGPRIEMDAATLVGWIDEPTDEMYSSNNRTRAVRRTLLVADVPIRPVPGASSPIPQALVTRRSLTTSSSARSQSSDLVLSNGDGVSFEYRLPYDSSRFTVESLRLDLAGNIRASNADQSANPLGNVSTMLLYDWQSAQWAQIEIAFGQNRIDAPERFISPLGVVRLRLTFRVPQVQATTGPVLSFQTFDLAVSGRTR